MHTVLYSRYSVCTLLQALEIMKTTCRLFVQRTKTISAYCVDTKFDVNIFGRPNVSFCFIFSELASFESFRQEIERKTWHNDGTEAQSWSLVFVNVNTITIKPTTTL